MCGTEPPDPVGLSPWITPAEDEAGPVREPAPSEDRAAAVRRQVGHELYNRLALLSAIIWTLGTFLLFITFAAGSQRPIPMAMLSMTAPLLPAALPWLLYRPLRTWLTKRRLRSQPRLE
jgi:hypothetical protein